MFAKTLLQFATIKQIMGEGESVSVDYLEVNILLQVFVNRMFPYVCLANTSSSASEIMRSISTLLGNIILHSK